MLGNVIVVVGITALDMGSWGVAGGELLPPNVTRHVASGGLSVGGVTNYN